MLLAEHNRWWNVERQLEEFVQCNYFDGSEISQYDRNCAACWYGHQHTWEQHDAMIHSHRKRLGIVLVDHSRYFTLTGQPWQIYADQEVAKYPATVQDCASAAYTFGGGWHLYQHQETLVKYRLDVNVVDRHITIIRVY